VSLPGSHKGLPSWTLTTKGIAAKLNKAHKGLGDQFLAWVKQELAMNPKLRVDEGSLPPADTNSPLSWYAAFVLANRLPNTIAQAIEGAGRKVPRIVQLAGEGIYKTPGTTGLAHAGSDVGSAINDVKSALSNPFEQLFASPNLWARVGEAVIGGAVLLIGINSILKGTPVGNAAKNSSRAAKTVVKALK